MIAGVKELVDAELAGKENRYIWRKTPSANLTTTGHWYDLAYASGMPTPNYYIGTIATATQLKQSTDGGIYHGPNVSPSEKYLRLTTALCTSATPLPLTMILCDYLLFYPFIDEGTTDQQDMINASKMPRYTDGEGVQVMAVSVAPKTGGQSFFFTYTNSEGVGGRVSQTVVLNNAQTNGTIATTSQATNGGATPFIGLQNGDTGVRSIESVTMLGADVGLFTLVLVKPLGTTVIREITAPAEKDYLMESSVIPRIYDDAFLGFVCLPTNSGIASAVITGDLKVIWT